MLAVVLLMAVVVEDCHAIRGKKFDCKVFCQKSAFRGSVGSCHCGFALFSAKRSSDPSPNHR